MIIVVYENVLYSLIGGGIGYLLGLWNQRRKPC